MERGKGNRYPKRRYRFRTLHLGLGPGSGQVLGVQDPALALPFQQVAVDAQGYVGVSVAHPLGHQFHGGPAGQVEASVGVPEIVDPYLAQAKAFRDPP